MMDDDWRIEFETSAARLITAWEAAPGEDREDRVASLLEQMRDLMTLERAVRAGLQERADELRQAGLLWREIAAGVDTSLSNAYQRWRAK